MFHIKVLAADVMQGDILAWHDKEIQVIDTHTCEDSGESIIYGNHNEEIRIHKAGFVTIIESDDDNEYDY